jgi:hypothetical protein
MDRLTIVLAVAVLVATAVLFVWARSNRASDRRSAAPRHVEPGELGLAGSGVGVVGFSTAYCLPCKRWAAALGEAGVDLSTVDVGERTDLARKYRITETPLLLAVRMPDGEVLESYRGEPEPASVDRLAALTSAAVRG